MKRYSWLLLLLFLACSPQKPQDILSISVDIPHQYVVVLKEKPIIKDGKIKDPDRKNQARRNSQKRKEKREKLDTVLRRNHIVIDTGMLFTDIVVGFKARLTATDIRNLKNDNAVEDIYADFEIKLRNPMQQSEIINLRNPMQQDYWDDWDFIDRIRGITCAVNTTGGPVDASGKTTVVWILDTGVQSDHPDLNVETDPELAVSFTPGESGDENGHGTHVAGIVGAYENTLGSTGVSAGARIIPVKVLEHSGSGRWSYLLSGLEHVARYNSDNDVVNLSLGAYGINLCKPNNRGYRLLREKLRDLASDNTFIVIAAGNDGAEAENSLPGCIDETNIFTVAAVECDNTCADYSNFGYPPVDWIAVGSNVFSTYKGGNYRIMSGTSMAAAVVSGVIHAKGGEPVEGDHSTCGTPGHEYHLAKTR
jgi:subtilisin family serine protease